MWSGHSPGHKAQLIPFCLNQKYLEQTSGCIASRHVALHHQSCQCKFSFRVDVSLSWQNASSSSSCGTAPSYQARGSHALWLYRPHHTHHCQVPLQPGGTFCQETLLSAWRWRKPPGYDQPGPPQSQASGVRNIVHTDQPYSTGSSSMCCQFTMVVIVSPANEGHRTDFINLSLT